MLRIDKKNNKTNNNNNNYVLKNDLDYPYLDSTEMILCFFFFLETIHIDWQT